MGAEFVALVGVVVGAGASYLTTALSERARWRRQLEVRWDERRLVAYSDYVGAVKDIVAVANRLAAHRGLTPHATPLEPTERNLADLDDAEVRRIALVETVRLLTDTDTMTAVTELNRCVWHLSSMSSGRSPADPAQWQAGFAAYRSARDEFHRCARATLGIAGVAISHDQSWPPRWAIRNDGPPTGPDEPPAAAG
ncbi:hypothetical protein OG689_02165 [Kitasatospora sp. NBC_00240]|uniref:hypothetical protein n=1 Tax=Kitasatospora sp. NBC_00240 TaxID=2903567 RepID=UPI00224CF24C|nr:hypothetical protein [Kitasatospora sp. NBC_00240]MCX5208126.1 hypothetical protein [Kitasatospora sp. NBC_00240]